MNILITGFMPFGGNKENITQTLLNHWSYTQDKHHVFTHIFPTVFHGLDTLLKEVINTYKPDILIHLGEHGKASSITLERIAINLDDARIPDNANNQPKDLPIIKDGPVAYFSNFPLREIEIALSLENIPVTLSYTAGTFVCNHLFYLSQHEQSLTKNRMLSGFIHIPSLHNQKETSEFNIAMLERALTIIVDSCIQSFMQNA